MIDPPDDAGARHLSVIWPVFGPATAVRSRGTLGTVAAPAASTATPAGSTAATIAITPMIDATRPRPKNPSPTANPQIARRILATGRGPDQGSRDPSREE